MFVVVVDDDERCVCGAGGGGKKGEPLQKPLKTSGGIYTFSFPTRCSLAAGINPGILAWVPLVIYSSCPRCICLPSIVYPFIPLTDSWSSQSRVEDDAAVAWIVGRATVLWPGDNLTRNFRPNQAVDIHIFPLWVLACWKQLFVSLRNHICL